ncbi:hypothetical protein [Geodermatophilus sp. DSM 44513]|uniref:hypothetical protein n=1 Tax=Geodermatophilus sp. DSM 44513 TaxID=1528104 RepID=UPI00127ED590|nr:hypothetical protein [Geodermatophilus sp. DSM 44513]WNV75710.1 hypothetical protein RTG05_00180 [Geodermatophilus sp. DSM 44513]
MNDIALLRAAGPEGPALSTQARHAARATLLAEIGGRPTARRRPLPGRRPALRLGAGLVAVAAAWAGAVVIAAPDPVGPPPGSVTLVDFEMPTFPLSLDPEPPGLRPAFDGSGTSAMIASYHDAGDREGFSIHVGDDEPERPSPAPDEEVGRPREVEVAGRDAELVRGSRPWCTGPETDLDCTRRGYTQLVWEREDGQWVRIEGHGAYDDPARVTAVAESLVDRPQPAVLAVGLAPAGWSVLDFKMGRVLTLVNDAYEQQTLTVHLPLPEDVIPPDDVRESIMAPVGPQLDVTVNGRPAQLVLCDSGYLDQQHWFLQAQFPDGTTFVLQVPDAFTQQQVLELAAQVTYAP